MVGRLLATSQVLHARAHNACDRAARLTRNSKKLMDSVAEGACRTTAQINATDDAFGGASARFTDEGKAVRPGDRSQPHHLDDTRAKCCHQSGLARSS